MNNMAVYVGIFKYVLNYLRESKPSPVLLLVTFFIPLHVLTIL